ncbi:MAG: hypothetical protein JST26_04860 [Bacteroidetes bacterium]|nr:hypothetical protein [Bacteroidota bacterium]
MSLAELIHLIRAKNYLFEVVIPGSSQYGKQSIQRAEELYGNLENYFQKVAQARNLKELTVALFAKNGTSTIRRDIVMATIPAVVESTTLPLKSTTAPVAQSSTTDNQVYKPFTPTHEKQVPMITKADIEVVQLKTENKYLAEKVDELKHRNKELERKNDEYYNENLRLTREHATEKDKRDLEFKQKELDLVSKQKQGLSGIMEDVKTMPAEAWQFIAGLLPNHPMAKGLNQAQTQSNDGNALNGASKHSDPDAQICLDMIHSILLKQTPEVVGMLTMLTEHLALHPDVLKVVFEKFFPGQHQQATTTNNGTN